MKLTAGEGLVPEPADETQASTHERGRFEGGEDESNPATSRITDGHEVADHQG